MDEQVVETQPAPVDEVLTVEVMGDRLLVLQFNAEKIKNGIIIPDAAEEAPLAGEVVAVGKGVFIPELGAREVSPYRRGDHVTWSKYSGMPFPLGDKTYLLLMEAEILVRLKRAPFKIPHDSNDPFVVKSDDSFNAHLGREGSE